MDFKTLDELKQRAKPALYSKLKEIHALGYKIVSTKDIWDYLVKYKWNNKKDIELNELVSDILYENNYSIYNYVLEELKKKKDSFDKETDVL